MNAPPTSSHSGNDTLRAVLRRERIAARLALGEEEHQQLSQRVENRLGDFLTRHPAGILGFYWPWRKEFDCRPLIAQLLQQQTALSVCLPVVLAPNAPLEFRRWTTQSPLSIDRYGIHYPANGDTLLPDTLLIPVNAFDARGFRLGYGAGYYDRTLAALTPRPLTIGIGFELARVECLAPQAHDIPLDVIVTEKTTQIFSRSPEAE